VHRAKAAQARALELIDQVRRRQTVCPVCGERLGTSRGVLFQGDWLVHAACWRDDPKPFDLPGRVALSPRSEAPQRTESSGASTRKTRWDKR
jgi:hypothetical protein